MTVGYDESIIGSLQAMPAWLEGEIRSIHSYSIWQY
jgi:hypothetical protein